MIFWMKAAAVLISMSLTDSEAIADGKAVLDDLYGSPATALAEMKKLAPGLSDAQYEKISAIAATSVLAVLAKILCNARNACRQSPIAAPQGGGILATIISAILKGLVAGRQKPARPTAAQAAELFQLFRHAAAQNHAAQDARENADTGRYFRTNSWNAEKSILGEEALILLRLPPCKRATFSHACAREKAIILRFCLLPSRSDGRRCPTGRMRALRC